jgi:hypothetical protein
MNLEPARERAEILLARVTAHTAAEVIAKAQVIATMAIAEQLKDLVDVLSTMSAK